jgi:hypothetical protein
VEDGIQGDILWDNSEKSGKGAAFSKNGSTTEGSLDILCD